MAQIRPPAGAPVIDEARLAHEFLEPLRLAYRCVILFEPYDDRLLPRLHGALGIIQQALRRADIAVDEIQIALQCGQTRWIAGLSGGADQSGRRIDRLSRAEQVSIDLENRIGRFVEA